MSTPTGVARMSAVMDGLVADVRSARDVVINTLDAVDRQTKLSSQSLARQIQRFCAERAQQVRDERAAQAQQPVHQERDARFDPEDEWELRRAEPAPDADEADEAVSRGAAPGRGARAVRDDDDDDDLPQTWLR